MFSMMHIKPPLFLSSDSKSSKTKENSTEFSYGISLDRIRMPTLQKYSRKTHMGSSLSQMPPTQELLMRPSNGRAQSMNLQCSQTGENIGAFRASAKAGININESMEFLIREIIKRMEGMASEGNQRCSLRIDRVSFQIQRSILMNLKRERKKMIAVKGVILQNNRFS